MKKLFLFLLRKYSKSEKERMEIYKELWYQVKSEYSEQTAFGNVYNMNIEVLMANPFLQSCVHTENLERVQVLKTGLNNSFDEAVDFIKKEGYVFRG